MALAVSGLGPPSFSEPAEVRTRFVMNEQDPISTAGARRPDHAAWKEIVARYQKPSVGRGVWQIANTLVPYAALWYLMYLSLSVSYWLVVPLAVVAARFMVRLVLTYHECWHCSLFK